MVCPLGIPFYYSVSLSINQGKCPKKNINFSRKTLDFYFMWLYNRKVIFSSYIVRVLSKTSFYLFYS